LVAVLAARRFKAKKRSAIAAPRDQDFFSSGGRVEGRKMIEGLRLEKFKKGMGGEMHLAATTPTQLFYAVAGGSMLAIWVLSL
jgi:hypothetical protein